ncbi:uncharacterized protein [Mycetomoellerius zeteki]|uniref:uncharacterized protein n=1 Tax=Mycetomoellerius zeteki TaxID=64791 RepID=UPI00084E82D9|nr:PREDICTED: uncharacterized protein LOC108725311 [Trachymyrmex zeteki]
MLYITVLIVWLFIYVFRFLLINYVCERVSTKANATGNFINKLSYLTYDTEIHENILQFLLQIVQSPLKFYGLGLFQFGFKFLYGFFASTSTLLVIYIQTSSFGVTENISRDKFNIRNTNDLEDGKCDR